MIAIFKIILLVCFAGLVIVVVKNRIANPEARIQFSNDLEKNKKRLRRSMVFLSRFGNEKGKAFLLFIKKFPPRFKKGFILFLRDMKRLLGVLKHTFTQQAKELREDMKAFELPLHKEDFLERLHKETLKEEKKEGIFLEPKEKKEEELKGFQVSKLSKEHLRSEIEVDKHILEEKEQELIEAIAKHPDNPTFYKKLGKIYLQMNNKDDAKNCLEYALKLGARDPEVKSILGEIEKSPSH